jgi:hypothetical protein
MKKLMSRERSKKKNIKLEEISKRGRRERKRE